jgi:hypothetical protein
MPSAEKASLIKVNWAGVPFSARSPPRRQNSAVGALAFIWRTTSSNHGPTGVFESVQVVYSDEYEIVMGRKRLRRVDGLAKRRAITARRQRDGAIGGE